MQPSSVRDGTDRSRAGGHGPAHGGRSVAARWVLSVGLVGALALSVPRSAEAHRVVNLSICIPYYPGADCARRDEAVSYRYGSNVPIRGRARPEHGGTVKIQRRKGAAAWRTVARVDLEGGRYRYVWQTRRRHADQDTPYKFRATLARHDRSLSLIHI